MLASTERSIGGLTVLLKGNIKSALSVFQAESIASMPPIVKQWAEGIDSKLDKAVCIEY